MTKKQRAMLIDLLGFCNVLGGCLDRTSTHESKLWDRQEALMDVYKVLYGVLTQHKENDYADEDWDEAEKSLENIKQLTKKVYPDRIGRF